jgi:hypothetical protein
MGEREAPSWMTAHPPSPTPISAVQLTIPGGKAPKEIEKDIEQTRAEMGDALDALQAKLAPQQVLALGISALQQWLPRGSRTSTFPEPGAAVGVLLPAALIGIGVFLFTKSLSRLQPPEKSSPLRLASELAPCDINHD